MTDEELIAKFQARVAAGEIDLRPLGELIFGKFDQDWPARLIALARRGAAVRWMPIAEAPKPSAPFSRTSPMDENFKVELIYRGTGTTSRPGGQHAGVPAADIRVTHIPTGIMAQYGGSRSQHACRTIAMEMVEWGMLAAGIKPHKKG